MSTATSRACDCSPTRSAPGSCTWPDGRAHEYATAPARMCDVFARIEDRHGVVLCLRFRACERSSPVFSAHSVSRPPSRSPRAPRVDLRIGGRRRADRSARTVRSSSSVSRVVARGASRARSSRCPTSAPRSAPPSRSPTPRSVKRSSVSPGTTARPEDRGSSPSRTRGSCAPARRRRSRSRSIHLPERSPIAFASWLASLSRRHFRQRMPSGSPSPHHLPCLRAFRPRGYCRSGGRSGRPLCPPARAGTYLRQMATVTYDHVTKRFGDFLAVNDLNLAVRDSEFLVLVGPSGCGKTTALRMLAGLEQQTTGDIRIGERVVNDVPPKDRDIAMVFQNYALYPHMSVYDNIAFGLKLRGMPKAEIDRRVNEVGKMLGIGQLLKRKPKELSGGQRPRVAVGRAISRE